jgi:hypothetical protein
MAPKPLRKVPALFSLLSFLLFFLLLNRGELSAGGASQPSIPPKDGGGASPGVPVPGEGSFGELILDGRVRLVGTARFPALVLSDGEGRDWYLEGADRELLAPFEQRWVRVRGRGEYRELLLANGQRAGIRRFLRDLSLLDPPPGSR